jgi:hypothetical protein
MPLFVQLKDKKGADVWHTVESFETAGDGANASLDFKRAYKCGCGLEAIASAAAMAEAENQPWTHRHVAKGCFTTAQDT